MYCPNCNNLYEITRHVKHKVEQQPQQQKASQPEETGDDIQKSFFICKNCGTNEKLQPGTIIIKKTSNIQQTSYEDPIKSKYIVNAPYLPHTRQYICPNTECASHKDHSKREAVFYRMLNTFRLMYICKECNTKWTT